jgi:RNA dependent RNA polymerase
MASRAVDFTKSGVPVNRQSLPRPDSRLRPDFLSFPGDDFEKDTYPSNKALGRMFRAVPVSTRPLEILFILISHDLTDPKVRASS